VVEEGLNQLPYYEKTVTTPTGLYTTVNILNFFYFVCNISANVADWWVMDWWSKGCRLVHIWLTRSARVSEASVIVYLSTALDKLLTHTCLCHLAV